MWNHATHSQFELRNVFDNILLMILPFFQTPFPFPEGKFLKNKSVLLTSLSSISRRGLGTQEGFKKCLLNEYINSYFQNNVKITTKNFGGPHCQTQD
jgi:hypothetical protein